MRIYLKGQGESQTTILLKECTTHIDVFYFSPKNILNKYNLLKNKCSLVNRAISKEQNEIKLFGPT